MFCLYSMLWQLEHPSCPDQVELGASLAAGDEGKAGRSCRHSSEPSPRHQDLPGPSSAPKIRLFAPKGEAGGRYGRWDPCTEEGQTLSGYCRNQDGDVAGMKSQQ